MLTVDNGKEGSPEEEVLCSADPPKRRHQPVKQDLDAENHQEGAKVEVGHVLDDGDGQEEQGGLGDSNHKALDLGGYPAPEGKQGL